MEMTGKTFVSKDVRAADNGMLVLNLYMAQWSQNRGHAQIQRKADSKNDSLLEKDFFAFFCKILPMVLGIF